MDRSFGDCARIVLGAGVFLMPLTAVAQDLSENAGDIIVTARRTEERLQDVPISITVYNQAQLDDRNISTTADLAIYTPSLTVNQRYGAEKANFAIRGFNQDQYTSPTVGIYFADVVGVRAQGGTASANNVGVGAFMDLQNVQVLKGPQGTLFGRNTTGGAILLVPRKPTSDFEGYVEGTIGNYDLRRVQGVINLPLAEAFKVRVSMDRQKRDGYLRNLSGIGPKDYNDLNYLAGRLSILGELTPNLENYTIASFSNSDTNGAGSRLVLCNPGAVGFAALTALSACDQIARQNARGDGLLDIDSNNPDPVQKINQWQVINTTTWEASDTITLKNIISYGEYRERDNLSLYNENFTVSNPPPDLTEFGLPPFAPGTPYNYVLLTGAPGADAAAGSTFTEELQIQGRSADGRLNYVAGGYLEFSRPLGRNSAYLQAFLNCTSPATQQCDNSLFIGSLGYNRSTAAFDNHGVFAQGTYALTDKLSLTVGGRFTFDKVVVSAEDLQYAFLPDDGGVSSITCQDTLSFQSPDGGPLPVTDAAQCRKVFTEKSSKPTWLINMDYNPDDDVLLYAKYARGYRQGGISPIGIGLETWGPETVDAFEIGAKASFRGAVHGYLNVAAFYNDFRDQQVNAGLVQPGGAGSTTIINVGSSVIKGIEVEGAVTFFDSLRLDLGYTYLDTEVKVLSVPELPADSPYEAIITSLQPGDPLPNSPKNRVTLTATYSVPLAESLGELSFGATFTHTAKQNANADSLSAPLMLRVMPATDLLNLNVNWDRAFGSPIDLAFFATNVTNQIYPVTTGGGYDAAGFGDWIMAPPRMYGFRLRYNFGR